jgi:phospholipid/cholesterol/gamma-HCH transport system substrate-binding protein
VTAARRKRVRRLTAVIGLVLIAATGCKFNGIYSFPLPGAVANGAHTYTVNIQFADVQDLVPYSAVKVDDATVGHVKSVAVQGTHALVVAQIKDSVVLPANTTALVSETSLLGEKFVSLQPPQNHAQWRGKLTKGMTIGLPDTDSDATVEEVLGALSLVLNGGGLQQIQTISSEINQAMSGRESNTRDLLNQLKTLATSLNGQKSDILTALRSVDHLATTVQAQESTVTDTLEKLPTALQILADNRVQLTKMLTSLSHLGDVATKVINSSRDDLLTNLRNLEPTLTQLAAAGQYIPTTLQILFTFPNADGTQDVYRGDYTNIDLQIDLSTASLMRNFGYSNLGVLGGTSKGTTGTTGTSPTTGATKTPTPKLPIPLPSLPTVPTLPKLPTLPLPKLGGSGSTGTSGSNGGSSGGLLGGISGLLGPNGVAEPEAVNGPLPVSIATRLDQIMLEPLQ